MVGERKKRALDGVRVIEWAEMVAGPYCARLLADLGAEVIKIESPGSGDAARRMGPFPDDLPHPEKSGLFLYLNTNKYGITLDPCMPSGRRLFERLIANADLLIEDKSPAQMRQANLDHESLRAIHPGLIVVSITPFGQTGPHAEWKTYPLNTVHAGMLGYLTPWVSKWPDREPIQPGGMIGEYGSGLSAATAALAALFFQRKTGKGQHVDVSKQEAVIALNRVNAPQFPNEGQSDTRFMNMSGLLGALIPCKDGYVVFQINETHHWQGFVQLLGNPEWARDPMYLDGFERGRRFESEIKPRVIEWAKNFTREELYHRGQAANCPFAMVMSTEDVARSEHLRERGFFVEVDHPVAGRIPYAGAPFKMSETPWEIRLPAPLLGQHNEIIYCERLGLGKEDLVVLGKARVI